MKEQTKQYPKVNEVFELTLNGKDPRFLPSSIARDDVHRVGFCEYSGWMVRDRQTRSFKLVEVGYCFNWKELTTKLKAEGKIPESQWLKAFAIKFPNPDCLLGSVGVADNVWFAEDQELFLCLNGKGEFCLLPGTCTDDFGSDWLWLMEVPAPVPTVKQSRH